MLHAAHGALLAEDVSEALASELWAIQGQLFPRAAKLDHIAAAQLLDIAVASLATEVLEERMARAAACVFGYTTAVSTLLHGVTAGVRNEYYGNLPKLVYKTENLIEMFVQAAYRASQPLVALEAIERLTSIVLTMRMDACAMSLVEKANSASRDLYANMEHVKRSVTQIEIVAKDGNPLQERLNEILLEKISVILESPLLTRPEERFVYKHACGPRLLCCKTRSQNRHLPGCRS